MRHFHLKGQQGSFSDSAWPWLQLMLRCIKKATFNETTKARLPITPTIPRQVWQAIHLSLVTEDHLMLWAAMTTCFYGFLRAGEVCSPTFASYDPSCHLCNTDKVLGSHTAPTKLFITIKVSKTDPFCQGVTITLGKTDRQLCPMTSILSYIAHWGSQPGPPFRFRDGSFFTQERFVREGRQLLTAAGTDPTPLFRSQFSYWCGNHSSPCRPGSCPDTDSGTVEELRLSATYLHSLRLFSHLYLLLAEVP